MSTQEGLRSSLEIAKEPGAKLHWRSGLNGYHAMVFACCWMGGIFDGMDSTLMTVVGPKALVELLGSTDKILIGLVASWVGAAFLLGWTLGGVLFGVIGDRLGRVRSMVISILLYALFTGLAGMAHNWQTLAVCRFLTGLGIGGELVSISTFLAEVWPNRTRALAVGALITSYQAGVFIAGAIHTLLPGWRETFWVGVLPALLVIFLRSLLRESDKWLHARQRAIQPAEVDSVSVEKTDAPALSASVPENIFSLRAFASHLFERANRKNLFLGSLAFGGLLIGYWASLSWVPYWIQDILGSHAAGSERGIATMVQGLAAVVGCLISGFLANSLLGRRGTIAIASVGCLLVSLALFIGVTQFSFWAYCWVGLLGFFIGLNQAVMYIYLPELFPTLVRASATGFCLNMGRIVTAVSVFFVGDFVRLTGQWHLGERLFGRVGLSSYGIAAACFALFYLLTACAALCGEETRGRELLD